MAIHFLGWIPDKEDKRDFVYSAPKAFFRKLPKEANIAGVFPTIYQQGLLGSCVGNAVAAQVAASHIIFKKPDPVPSRLFIYYNAREMEGTQNEDAGCMIRDAIKSVNKQGVCSETLWKYDISKFAIHPPKACYDAALKDRVLSYHRIMGLTSMKSCIAEGFPFSIGVKVCENFPFETTTGEIPMPMGEELGGHAMVVVGYNDTYKKFIVRNSWGIEWGYKGYGTIDYAFLGNPLLAMDFWTVRVVQ